MKPTAEERKALIERRIERAYETREETKEIVNSELWLAAANRMYYACYYLTTALLVSHGIDATTHTGVIRMPGMHFVSQGFVSKEMNVFDKPREEELALIPRREND